MPTRVGAEVYQWQLLPLSLFTKRLHSSILSIKPLSKPSRSTSDLEPIEERQPLPREPISVPISASLRSALRQASVQQCCHRSCDKLPASRRAGHVLPTPTRIGTSVHEQACITIRYLLVTDPSGRTSITRRPITYPSYRGSPPSITY